MMLNLHKLKLWCHITIINLKWENKFAKGGSYDNNFITSRSEVNYKMKSII